MSDYSVIAVDPMTPEPGAGAPAATNGADGVGHTVAAVSSNGDHAPAEAPSNNGVAPVPAPGIAYELADTVERLVLHLRDLSRRDRRIGSDIELSELAVEAFRKARELKKGSG